VGAADTGLSMPAAGVLSASAGGGEVMRAAAGTLSLGGAGGAHGFEVSTPGGAVNRPRALGSAAGAPVAVQASGSDGNVELSLQAKGAAALSFSTGGGTQAQVGHVASAVNWVQLLGGASGSPGRVGLVAAGADANVSLVLAPKRTGALIAQLPDGGVAGGQTRGAGAVDLQTARSAAGMVAAGANSVISGGQNNTATGPNGAVGGGSGNGVGNTGTVAGGNSNFADGIVSWVPGGFQASARGHWGRGAWSGGQFGTLGDAQSGEFVLRRQTTDATAARLTADGGAPGGANTLNLPANATFRLKLLVVAQQAGGSAGTAGDCASWEANILVKRGATAAATSLVGGTRSAPGAALAAITPGTGFPPALADAAAGGWLLAVAADTANGGVAVSATGEANKTIRWVVRALSAEVAA
jgi:hypothetical protein